MSKFDQKEALRNVAEKIKQQKEESKRREQAFYERITSGKTWIFFKGIVIFCLIVMVLTIIETYVDGPTKKLNRSDWRIDRSLYAIDFQSIWVKDAMFNPHFDIWFGHQDEGFEMTYSPIFHDEKRLSFLQIPYGTETPIRRYVLRSRSIYAWFPFLQIMLLIPLITYLLRRPKPWFNFARILSMLIIFPATVLTLLYVIF